VRQAVRNEVQGEGTWLWLEDSAEMIRRSCRYAVISDDEASRGYSSSNASLLPIE